jgi:hypothetical protein
MENSNQFLYIKKNSISRELCNDMINLFEQEDDRYEGVCGMDCVVNKNVKDTTDFVISNGGERWDKINKTLCKELANNVNEYLRNCNNTMRDTKYQYLSGGLAHHSMQMQKYYKNVGKFSYHEDSKVDLINKSDRKITFMWYLNNVTEGGETEFWSSYNIKPEVGKLVLFPADWTFPHTGKVPISNNKYIVTGWLCKEYN